MAQQRRLKMRYRTVGPKEVEVVKNMAMMDDTGSLQQKPTKVKVKTWMVYFPQGHSIRIERDELVRMGFHLKPKMVDMDTGETVDFGGDPYDFGPDTITDEEEASALDNIVLEDDLEDENEPPKKTASAKG